MIWIFIFNSPIEKSNKKEILKILNGIAEFNNKNNYFDNINNEEYQNILNEICGESKENDDKLIPKPKQRKFKWKNWKFKQRK